MAAHMLVPFLPHLHACMLAKSDICDACTLVRVCAFRRHPCAKTQEFVLKVVHRTVSSAPAHQGGRDQAMAVTSTSRGLYEVLDSCEPLLKQQVRGCVCLCVCVCVCVCVHVCSRAYGVYGWLCVYVCCV